MHSSWMKSLVAGRCPPWPSHCSPAINSSPSTKSTRSSLQGVCGAYPLRLHASENPHFVFHAWSLRPWRVGV
eukprot:1143456-Pelagomonas_calceolata.AAC.5